MKVLVFEPQVNGHALHHVAKLLPALLELRPFGVESTVATPASAPGRAEYDTHLKSFQQQVTIDAWMPPRQEGMLASAKTSLEWLATSIRRTRPDALYVTWGDGLSQMLGACGQFGADIIPPSIHSEVLLLRGDFAYPQPSMSARARARLSWQLSARAPWSRVHHLDQLVVDHVRRHGGPGRGLRLMPEPMEPPVPMDKQTARRKLGIPEDGRYIGAVGLQDERKGIDGLVRAFVTAVQKGKLAHTDRLLLFGKQSPVVRQLIQDIGGVIHRHHQLIEADRYVEDAEMSAAIAAMDLVCVPYLNHIGSATIVIRSAQAGRPVLTGDNGWCGKIVPQSGLGWTDQLGDEELFANRLSSLLDASAAHRAPPIASRYLAFHSPANYRAHWTEGLRRQLGSGPSFSKTSWQWVLAR